MSSGLHGPGRRLAPAAFCFLAGDSSPAPPSSLWGEAGAPGGTVHRAAVRKRGAPALRVAQSTNFPIKLG